MTNNTSAVRQPSQAYRDMKEAWVLIYALMGGNKAMRAGGKTWLPQNPRESDEAYKARLQRTFLVNYLRRTVKAAVGQAFMHNITISNLPPELEYLRHNADGAGQSITSVAATLFEHLLTVGKAHPFVDFPETGGLVSVAEVVRGEKLPIINTIDPRDLIGWRTEYGQGREIVTQIRFLEREEIYVDEFHSMEIERVRVVEPDRFTLYRQRIDEKSQRVVEHEFEMGEEGVNTLGYIPIVPIYEEKIASFVAIPPLDDLAWLNLRHYQSSSEQNNILHVARVPILFGTNLDMEELEIGVNSGVGGGDNADLKYVEHSGAAIGAGKQDLDDLEARMAKMGADILYARSMDRQTATARAMDKSDSLSLFQTMLRNLEDGLERCIQICGEWINVDATEVKVVIGNDLSVPENESNVIENMDRLTQEGKLTEQEELQELKRRGILGESVTE